MEYLKRKIKCEREETQETMTVSMIDGIRLSIRWAKKPEEDVVLNFTREETRKIKELLRH